MWKLTNTRYLLAAVSFLPAFNQFGDPQHHSAFRIAQRFNLVPKPGYSLAPTPGLTLVADAGDLTPQLSDTGTNALIEDSDVLPRAKLYSNWLTPPNDQTTLQMLNSPPWDPAQSVLVSSNTPVPPPQAGSGGDPGTVSIASYQPNDIKLQANVKTNAVLLYNDRISDGWSAWVDGKPSPLLRCNYIMRGVFLPPAGTRWNFASGPR